VFIQIIGTAKYLMLKNTTKTDSPTILQIIAAKIHENFDLQKNG
jgi:hypothetical protein